MTSYLETIRRIEPPDETAAARCRAYWNQIAKPLYGMGILEDMLIRIAAVQGTEHVDIRKKPARRRQQSSLKILWTGYRVLPSCAGVRA